MATIAVKYSCRTCLLDRVDVIVPARELEDVVDWLEATMIHVGRDHRQRSPGCPSTACDLLVPQATHDKARVGEARKI